MGRLTGIDAIKAVLRSGTAALALAAAAAVATPADRAAAQAAPATVEQASYRVRMMLQRFDGAREQSHTQVAGVAQARRGDESWLEINFGHGSLVSTTPRRLQAGSFTNSSGVEAGLRYDHATGTLAGAPAAVASFHNAHIRPLLARGPAPGADATWSVAVTPAQLGMPGLGTQPITIELSRRHIRHDGRDYVLVHYRVPSAAYGGAGGPVVHWGEGVALADPGFATTYWNAALHRAVAQEVGGSGRPYRYSRTTAAVDARGNPLIDPRRIPEAAPHFARLYGHANEEVMGYTVVDGVSDQQPLVLAGRLDTLALALAEGGGGSATRLAAAYLDDARGNEAARPAPRPLVEARASREADAAPSAPATASAPAARADGGSSGADEMKRADAGKGGQGTPPPPSPPPLSMAGEIEWMNRLRSVFSGVVTWTNIVAGGEDEIRIFAAVEDALQAYAAQGENIRQQYEAARAAFQQASDALIGVSSLEPRAGTETARLWSDVQNASGRVDSLLRELEVAVRNGEPVTEIATALREARQAHRRAFEAFETHTPAPGAYTPRLNPGSEGEAASRAFQESAVRMRRLEQELMEHGRQGAEIATYVQRIPATHFQDFLRGLNATLGPLGIAMDAYSTGAALANFENQMARDPTTGQVVTSRQYGADNGLFWVDLGADFIGLGGSALTGDVPGFIAAAVNITTGSVTDLLIAARALRAWNQWEREQTEEQTRLARQERLAAEARGREIDALYDRMLREGGVVDQTREEIAGLEQELRDARAQGAEMALALLDERRRNREEAARLAEQERQRLIAEARAENERIYQENLRRPPTAEEWARFNADIAAAMRPDYPTAPPPTPEQVAARLAAAEARRRQEAEAAAQALAEAAAAAAAAAAAEQARREQLAQVQADAVAAREREAEERRRRNDEAEQRGFDIEPVNFVPPVWTPPVWVPPVWVPPEFDPPEASEIPWTDFDDDNWLQQGDNLAFNYGNMAGTVETDLSRWAEWLATQNVRELERLALRAGYPNLASALADAENILRLSQDEGYRRWAMTQPSCGGYVGCGPSFLERWWMKQATVALGDILADSRDIFSTAGLSDIGISGLNLSYLLRDNALQDGDIVDVRITQFGRVLFQGRTNLTNIGDRYSQLLRQGVAALEIFAVNEGSASPNTAQIVLDNVVRGNATQSYSLRTGQTATLRIETNARGQ